MGLPLIECAGAHGDRTAIVSSGGGFSYSQLLQASAGTAVVLLDGSDDLEESPVAFLVSPGFTHVAVEWGIWRAGGVAVPLAVSHPRPELERAIEDSAAEIVVVDPDHDALVRPIAARRGLRVLSTGACGVGQAPRVALPDVDSGRRALILYTSGTTSRPKGVVLTHRNLEVQIQTLVAAWGWRADDRILHVLPLHHVHGLVNALGCALACGAACEMLPRFDAEHVWRRLEQGGISLFMAVPTIYIRLIAAWDAAAPERRLAWAAACSTLRLAVSGSAALPREVMARWRSISGQLLLERYGMTEIGMALSNPLHGERRPGSVGTALPGVELRLADEQGRPVEPGTPGEILVRGPGVFLEYWRDPRATREAFRDGWFCTGDLAVAEQDSYRILGRRSVDIIKTAGHKVSALEIEEVLRAHPAIADCAVLGLPDPDRGERVAAAVVLRPGARIDLAGLQAWARERLAPYKVPTALHLLDELPANAVGKVLKPRLAELLRSG